MFVVKFSMNFDPTFLLEKKTVGFRDHKALCMCPRPIAALLRVLQWVKSTRQMYEVMGWG
jgi:hypothetical protein